MIEFKLALEFLYLRFGESSFTTAYKGQMFVADDLYSCTPSQLNSSEITLFFVEDKFIISL